MATFREKQYPNQEVLCRLLVLCRSFYILDYVNVLLVIDAGPHSSFVDQFVVLA